MALVVADRVKETTTTTGTGAISLAGADSNFQAFSDVLSNGDTTYYCIVDANNTEYEIGLGTYDSTGNTLARTTILASSNAGSVVNLAAGQKEIFITYAADKSVYLDASGNLPISGEILANGGIAFGDNDKATFGAGDDLQIYHDGTNSYISDTGTGRLILKSSSDLLLRSATDENYINAYAEGSVDLFYDNSKKLATTATGIDVTGTVTADGLTVDGVARIQGTATGLVINETDTTDLNSYLSVNGGVFKLLTVNDAFNSFTNRVNVDNATGDISFFNTAGTAKFYWDASAENLGIGTTGPIADLEINTNTSDSAVMIRSSDTGTSNLYLGDQSGAFRGGLKYDNSADSLGIYANGLSTADITIDSAGNVGIATSSPTEKLDVNGTVKATAFSGSGASLTGVDADTVDGVHGSSFLRSDVNDTFTSLITGNTLHLGGGQIISSGAQLQVNGFMRTGNIYLHEGGINPTANNLPLSNSSGVLQWNGSTVWNAGNDGSGSGLDADLLDGQHGSYYQPASTALTTSTSFGGDVSGTYNAIVVANDSHTHAFNNLTGKTSGTGDYATTGDIVSGKGSGGVALTVNDGKGNANVTWNHQDGTPEQNGNAARIEVNTDSTTTATMYFELKSNVSSGVNVDLTPIMRLTETAITAESGISFSGSGASLTNVDAATLDGLDSAENGNSVILKTASNGYLNIGNWIRVGSTTGLYNSTGHYLYPDATYGWRLRNGGSTTTASISLDNSAGSRVGWVYANDTGQGFLTTGGSWRFRIPASGSFQRDAAYTIWDSGNDGSGSGLDADLLDGVQGSSFLRSDAADTATGPITFQNSNDVQIYLNGNGTTWAGVQFADVGGSDNIFFNGANKTFSIGGGGSNVAGKKLHVDGGLSVGSTSDAVATPSEGIYSQGQISVAGSTVWNAGNDGSGSGLDADLLDGVHGSSFLRSDANDTLSSVLKITGANSGLIYEKSTAGGYVPVLAQHITGSGTHTGAVKIAFPVNGTADMICGWVDIFDYGATESISVFVGGYLYQTAGGNEWVNETAIVHTTNSTRNLTVRFGHDGTNNCIYIGELNTTWTYPQITCRDWTIGYSADIDAYATGTTISFEATAFQNVDATLTNNNPIASDADTVDGVQASQFLRSDASDAASQRIQFTANVTNSWDTIATASGSQGCIEIYNDGVGNDAFMSFHVGGDFACYFGLDGGINDLAVGGWSMGAASYRIWHVGNDGSGSGLDADTVDGLQATSFLRSDANDSFSGTLTGGAIDATTVTYDTIVGPATSSRDKIRVYSSSSYAIGMQSSTTFGGLNDWAMTFNFNNENDRGFWWGDDGHSTAQGAMALTTNGLLTVASGIRVGYGESDTTIPTANVLQVNGKVDADGYEESVYTMSGTTPSLSIASGSIRLWTLTGNSTPVDGLSNGQSITLMVDDGSAYTITWPTMQWSGGSAPTLATTGYSVITLWKAGGTLYGAYVGDMS